MSDSEKQYSVKQVIVVRKDLNMSRGKIAGQVSHACMKIFFKTLSPNHVAVPTDNWYLNDSYVSGWNLPNLPFFEDYINGSFTKIVVKVESEEELLEVYEKARQMKIHSCLIFDNTLQKNTVAGLGPWNSDELDKLTGHLSLL